MQLTVKVTNMPAGRPPKSKKSKITRGTLRKKPLRKTVAKAAVPSVYIPQSLTTDERLAWQSLSPVLKARGMLTADYAPAFEQLCSSWARLRQLNAAVREVGMTYRPPALDSRGVPVLDPDGEVVMGTIRATPEGQTLHAETKIFRMWLTAFGLTPIDVARVDLPAGTDDQPAGAKLLD